MRFGRHVGRRAFLASLAACCLFQGLGAPGAEAAPPARDRSELRSAGPLRIGVVGDSLGGDLADGMAKLFRDRRDVRVVKFTKAATGLIRDDVYDWPAELTDFVRRNELHAILAVMGGNDRQSFWRNGRRVSVGSPAWAAEYERRVAHVMTILKSSGARVYWVGLPIVKSTRKSRAYRAFNQVFRSQAARHGITYVDVWGAFLDADGAYTSFGPGPDGETRQLRKEDGLHFTTYGIVRFAQVVADVVGRDLKTIRSAR